MRGSWPLLSLLALAAAAGAACGSDSGDDNEPPIAHLTVQPELARAGEVVALIAQDSVDPDGVIVSYRYVFSDGTPDIVTTANVLDHRFPRGGRYEVGVVVTDNQGATAGEQATLTILEDPPAGGCLADTECRSDERCDDGVCVPAGECSDTLPCPAPLLCDGGFCRCPAGTALCGAACVALATDPLNCGGCGELCASPSTCAGGICTPPTDCGALTLCGDACVDISSDPDHCGGCDRPCPDDAMCIDASCAGLCDPGFELCGGACTDVRIDPENCGGCGASCDTGFCSASTCQIGPPGTLIGAFMPAYDGRVNGLTRVDGNFWAVVNGRRLQRFDPVTGSLFETFFINNSDNRRALGLSECALAGQALTGAFDQGNPFMTADLEVYDLGAAVLSASADNLGGAAAYDPAAGVIYVFQNPTQELVTLDGASFAELDRRVVAGLDFFDSFTDLALDGGGGLWAVRPRLGTVADGLWVNIDIASATVNYYLMPFDSEWVGGIVLADGILWAAGQFAVYQLVP